MPPAKKSSGKSSVKVKDMKAKKNPKGGTLNFTKNQNAAVDRKSGGDPSIIAVLRA